MPLLLNGQPVDILLPIFNKMDPQAQCRLRRCCKRMDNFVELYRLRINKRAGQSLVNLYVRIPGWGNEPMLWYVINGDLNWNVLDKWDARFKRIPETDFCYGRNKIQDVYSQLSAIYFNAIVLDFTDIFHFAETDLRERKMAFVTNQFIPFLRKLRLSCVFLGIDGANNLWLSEILSLCKFSRICLPFINRPVQVFYETIYELLPMDHCKELFIKTGSPGNTNNWILKYGRLESLRIACSKAGQHPLQFFIMKIKESKEARGKLKQLTATYHTWHPICDDLDADLIWEGEMEGGGEFPKRDYKFYTLGIPGGFAIIASFAENQNQTVTIHFLDDVTRETLFDFISPFIFFNTPIDSSLLYDQFISAESDFSDVKILSDRRQNYINGYFEPVSKLNKFARKFGKLLKITR